MKFKTIAYLTGAGLLALVALPAGCSLLSSRSSVGSVDGSTIGEVSTVWRWWGPNDRIRVEAFDDPDVKGVACHVTRAVTGGFLYYIGFQEDPTESSVSCRRYAPASYDEAKLVSTSGEYVFSQRTNLLFKNLQIRRFYDKKRRTLIYVVVTETLFSGSNHNVGSSVPLGAE